MDPISLTFEHRAFVADLIGAGLFGTSAEVVEAALERLRDESYARRERARELSQKLEDGRAAIFSGDIVRADDVFSWVLGNIAARTQREG
jgi:Arc/MetJ-type ribon-helix-helix transcriptional regulator